VRILLVGSLSWHPERIRSLSDAGHELWGAWARSMPWDQGPYPVLDGCVHRVAPDAMASTVARERIDCVLALFQVYAPGLWAPAAQGVDHDVWTLLRMLLDARAAGVIDAPVVFQFGFDVHALDPDVLSALDGVVYCNEEQRAYWTTPVERGGLGLDVLSDSEVVAILDGDRPKAEFMTDDFSEPLSRTTGEIHTACVGRPFGIDYSALAREGIHLHLYGNAFDDVARMVARSLERHALSAELRRIRRVLHLHPSLQPEGRSWDDVQRAKSRWVQEFSKYDAGWSYVGNPLAWPPLEERSAIPNRIGTYLLAGLPIISDRRPGLYRYDELVRRGVNLDLEDGDYAALRERLREARSGERRASAIAARKSYSFDASIPALVDVLERARATYFAKPVEERRRALPVSETPLVRLYDALDQPPAGALESVRSGPGRGFSARVRRHGRRPWAPLAARVRARILATRLQSIRVRGDVPSGPGG
jgi:hypothetical protein